MVRTSCENYKCFCVMVIEIFKFKDCVWKNGIYSLQHIFTVLSLLLLANDIPIDRPFIIN